MISKMLLKNGHQQIVYVDYAVICLTNGPCKFRIVLFINGTISAFLFILICIYSFKYLFIYSFIYLFIHLFIYLFINSLSHTLQLYMLITQALRM